MTEPYKEHQIGRFQILLPANHMLDQYQKTWWRYDTALGYIAQIVFQKYPDACAIDIGANVGDSAALIRSYADAPILCIEGNPEFIEYLEHNASTIGGIEIDQCFVGNDNTIVDFERINSNGGTATIVDAVSSEAMWFIEMKSLRTILENHLDFRQTKLLKIDTDGFDFAIIQKSTSVISALRPVLYFEYDTNFKPEGEVEALEAIKALFEIGYTYFLVYENFGNYLFSITAQDLDKFIDLNICLASNRKKSGTSVIFYFDICALTEEDFDLFKQIRQTELSLVRS
ncbi:FkbM family methyltransferase [Leptothermofonsia sp. ETS-13]|uniref:FkbM family methyltransferase n=1 Tax=Leptothermofonsia sp. ETS-13 TaxID=3035696 RepID=UPI003B9F7F6D